MNGPTHVCIADIICKDEHDQAHDRLTECIADLKKGLELVDDLDPEYMDVETVRKLQRIVTDAHWNINRAVYPLNEISKGRP